MTQACSLEQLRRALTENHIDLITLDLELHDSQGLLTVATVREIAPKIPILVITSVSRNELKKQLQEFHINRFISQFAQMEEVCEAISAALKGETWFSPEIKSGELGEAASRIGPFDQLAAEGEDLSLVDLIDAQHAESRLQVEATTPRPTCSTSCVHSSVWGWGRWRNTSPIPRTAHPSHETRSPMARGQGSKPPYTFPRQFR